MHHPFYTEHSHLETLSGELFSGHSKLHIKRDDLIHPIVSGNKWRKLKYQIEAMQLEGKNHLVTFGGAFSNHLIATACASATLGLKSSCFLRGNELGNESNHYLKLATKYGMELIPVTREAYRNKPALFDEYFGDKPQAFYVAEGGEGKNAIPGVAEIISELPFEPDIIIHASATATTAIGLLTGLQQKNWVKTKIISVPVLLNAEEQYQKISDHLLTPQSMVSSGFEFGGYAKTNAELEDFMINFISGTGILIDAVYTSKALFALHELIGNGKISKEESVVFLHTGGTLGSI